VFLNQVKNQSVFQGVVNMRKTKFSFHVLQVQYTSLKIIVGMISLNNIPWKGKYIDI
jgi:hypothetical protein